MLLELHHPLDGYYKGTRFDRSGVFKSLVFNGMELCAPWFEQYSPTKHDAVLGPAEEFSLLQAGPYWLKPGVGLLAPDSEPYDRFKLYTVIDPGKWDIEERGTSSFFYHTLEGYYSYTKEIRNVSESSFEIGHELKVQIPWEGTVYNHNFFTLGKMETGPSRMIDFPFQPEGTWRASYDSVAFTGGGVRFSRILGEEESVYSGNIHEAGKTGMPYDITLREGPLSVHIQGDIPVTHTVLWANHRIACVEPYNRLKADPGETLRWTIRYQFSFSKP